MFKFSRIAGILAFTSLAVFMLSFAAFAESDDNYGCSNRISGISLSGNINSGEINFDSHSHGGDMATGVADGSIIGIPEIVAPGDISMSEEGRELAACAQMNDDEFFVDPATGELDLDENEFIIKGYAWNTNLGFINFYCDEDGNDIVGEACGGFDYEVTVTPVDEITGGRILNGYAWNSIFGYIDFNVLNDPSIGLDPCVGTCMVVESADADEEKKVYMDEDGTLHGYAWTEAGVWMGFEGAKINLDGSIDAVEDEWCDEAHTKRVCIEIDPDPDFEFGLGVDDPEGVKIADGKEGYLIKLYLSDIETQLPLSINDFDSFELTFNWEDTVRRDQVNEPGEDDDFSDVETPWAEDVGSVGGGAITKKPITVTKANFNSYFNEVELGEYVLKDRIASYAPTSNMNTSLTTSTTPKYFVRNDVFFDGTALISNELKLDSVSYDLSYAGQPDDGTTHANGKVEVSLRFKPAVFLETLYANGFQDTVDAIRNIPISFTLALHKIPSLEMTLPSDFIKLILTLDNDEVSGSCGFDFEFYNQGASVNGLEEKNYSNVNVIPENLFAVASLADVDCEQDCSVYESDPDEFGKYLADKETCAACSFAGNAGLHSIVHYQVGNNDVYYYSNKLPRISSSIVNPVAVIHGNIYAPKVFSPSAAQKTQATGNVSVDVVRNTVNENVKTYLRDVEKIDGEGSECEVVKMNGVDGVIAAEVEVNGCDIENDYDVFEIGDENVLYFKNADVVFNLDSDNWDKKWVVIVDGGRVFIDKDLYHEEDAENLALVVMREQGGVCADANIYIDKGVKNIQANIAADCSIFSYDSSNLPGSIFELGLMNGLPRWDDFEDMIASLDNQLFIEGSISSRNTIGGADLDADGKPYLLLGTGETVGVTQDERYEAQLYDLNYLRLFKLKLKLSLEGLPVDQSCNKALTIQDMIAISEKKAEIVAASSIYKIFILQNQSKGVWYDGVQCDGINPLNKYGDDPNLDATSCLTADDLTKCSGDLTVLIEDQDKIAEGLSSESYEPVYVHYKPATSFVFKKTSRTTTY